MKTHEKNTITPIQRLTTLLASIAGVLTLLSVWLTAQLVPYSTRITTLEVWAKDYEESETRFRQEVLLPKMDSYDRTLNTYGEKLNEILVEVKK